jgi:hypothetical protein
VFRRYYHDLGVWLINGGSIGWLGLLITPLQSLVITINYNSSQQIFSRTLLPWLPRTRSILVHIWFCSVLLYNLEANIENTASSIVVYTAPLHNNGSYLIVACVFVAAGMCLPSRSLVMILHVRIFCLIKRKCIIILVSIFLQYILCDLHSVTSWYSSFLNSLTGVRKSISPIWNFTNFAHDKNNFWSGPVRFQCKHRTVHPISFIVYFITPCGVAPQLYSRGWVDPVPDPPLLR